MRLTDHDYFPLTIKPRFLPKRGFFGKLTASKTTLEFLEEGKKCSNNPYAYFKTL